MKITLTTEEKTVAQIAADDRNRDNPELPAWTAEQWVENAATHEIDLARAAQESRLKVALAENKDMMQAGLAIAASSPEKQAAAIAAALAELAK